MRALQGKGWILVDATYQPVNALSPSERDAIIRRDYPTLREDIKQLSGDQTTPLLLLKAIVCRILEPLLLEDGFNVLNRGDVVYFPSTGNQSKFHMQFGKVLTANGME